MAIEKKKSKKSDEDILSEARERFKLAEEAWQDVRDTAMDDLKFSAGDQWPEKIKAQRDREDRPCLTINRTPQFIRQVTNEQRQNRPSIKVDPVDDVADPEVARVLQGMIRHIEYDSNADIAYDTAFDGAVRKSFGFWRIITEYVSPRSFDQQIKIKSIRNAFSVYLDPHFKEPDGSDANWGFIFDDVPDDVYKTDHPGSELSNTADWGSIANTTPGWITGSTCRVAEYFTKEFEEVEIVRLSNGQVLTSDELTEHLAGAELPPGIEIKDKRKSLEPVVKWYKINGIEILENTTWLGIWIPIVPAFGDIIDIDGKLVLESVFRHAKDSQRMYNLWASAETETIGLAPKAPWIVAEGQITEENESQWATANTRTHAYLQYNPIDINGTPIGAPQRNVYEPPVQAITNARMQASEDLKATTGIYDSALGARSNETSGIAIRGRQQQAQTSNFHFVDNLTRSIKHTGRILVDLIPKVYDSPRIARIIGDEGQEEIVKINQAFDDHGEEKIFDLSKGKYDVTVETGPNFQTKRQEAVASMLEFTKSMPQQAAMFADLLVKNMDFPGSKEMSERLKKMLPPGIAEDNKDEAPLPPEAKAKMDQMGQMIDQLTHHLNDTKTHLEEANETIKMKSIEIESKERIEFAKMDVDLQKAMLTAAPNQAIQSIIEEIAHIHTRMELVGINNPVDQEFKEASSDQAIPQQQETPPQQPTGGNPPGPHMEG